jgi:hypothetical protein
MRDYVEAPGIENDKNRTVDTIGHEEGSISVHEDSADVSDRASKCAIGRRDVTVEGDAYELSDVVETALARALLLAAEAGRWELVRKIATELEGRREGRVVPKELTRRRANRR